MKFIITNVVKGLFFAVLVALFGCGGSGSTGSASSGSTNSLITEVGWLYDNAATDYYNGGPTCVLNVEVIYDESIAADEIDSFVVIAPNGLQWIIPASNSQFGTSSSGKPYIGGRIHNGAGPYTMPLAGDWVFQLILKNGLIPSMQKTFREPGSAIAATHQFLYSKEDGTPTTNLSQYITALSRFPSQGYTLQYSAVNGGTITTTGLSSVRTSFQDAEPRAYNMFCWLYDSGKNYIGYTTPEFSKQDHSRTNLITANGELSIMSASNVSSNGQIDLSTVKYLRFVYVDGAQFEPASYFKADYRSMSSLVAVGDSFGFNPGIRYPVPNTISSFSGGDTAMGDLDGNGRNDIVVMEAYGSRILVYYQNATGTFDAPQVINTSLQLKGIAIRDINNDGLVDLAVSGNLTTASSGWAGRVAVYTQNPANHDLNVASEYALSTNSAGSLTIADLNNDGLQDIVVASDGNSSNGLLSFLFQEADGTLGTEYAYTSVPVSGEIHVADINYDGLNDIVVQSGLKQLAVIKQLSPGVYSTSPDFYTAQSNWAYFRSFALGDLNGDGRTDIAIAEPGNNGSLNIFLQNTTGTFTDPTLINFTWFSLDEIKIADIDGDGLNDIIVLSNGNRVMVLRQSVFNSFQDYQTYLLPTQSTGGTVIHQAMSVGDVSSDGLPDIIASWAEQGVFVLQR